MFRELLYLERFPNIKLTRTRFATIWGGASLLEMLLSSMNELLSLNWEWDFVINLSESDYPVKQIQKLTEFLSANAGMNFVKSHGREVQRFIQKQGLDKTFVECDTHMWRTGDRELPWGIQIDGGSDWVALSKKFVQYIVNDTDELVVGLLKVFRHTLLPAESFFHTVLRNSKFCNTYIDNNLHVTNWKRKLGCKCQYKHVVDWCGCSPNDFKPEDWMRLQNTENRQLFFARKFEPIVNQAVILQLEQWLYGTEPKNVPQLKSYWQSVYNHLDLSPIPDDALLTVAESAARIRSKLIMNAKCASLTTSIRILEVTTYNVDDAYMSTLIKYEMDNVKVKLETAMKPKNTFLLTKSTNLSHRLKYLNVNTEYDQKEQTFRNYAQIIGPYSEPTLAYTFASSPNTKGANITILWIDSAGRLAEINEIYVDDSYVVNHVTPTLKQPLLPGIWIVKLVHKEQIAEIKFLITPLYYLSRNEVSQKQIVFLHSGSEVKEYETTQWDKYLPTNYERDNLEALAESNAKRFGPDLLEWIDNLIGKFYQVGHVCVVGNNSTDVCGINVQQCVDTSWSSYSYDPKSFIGDLNETTGSFNLW